ncbi:BTAD domain-containing putative transcriptional regulator [Kitasatospora sp. NPDC006697]|uniref:AfsR/SARP family transcriptional regulator n=1 Tax=Kitasatospora sp. NPDC006697 TaxID=3364020 RepID=UPI0036D11076
MERITFGVLGPVTAWDADGGALDLKGPRHRAVLARLILARRRVVPLARLVADLWEEPGPGATGAVQTFVGSLRRVLEPDRPPRAPSRVLVTEGPGYALRVGPEAVDAWRFEAAVGSAASLPPERAVAELAAALELWRGPAYAGFAGADWARAECGRLDGLRLHAVEEQARARLGCGRAAEAAADLEGHLEAHPHREEAWGLLALALYRTGRQADALAVLRRARGMLAERFGIDPGPGLRRLEADVLAQSPGLDLRPEPADAADRLWSRASAAYDRTVATGSRARLESVVGLVRTLAVTGGDGLREAQQHRWAAVAAAEEYGDPELTARILGAYDVPAIWTRADDPGRARELAAAAERTLARLPEAPGTEPARARLLTTVALELRGTRSGRGPRAAREAERLARRLDDPALLAFALNGVFMQSCSRAGLAPRRDAIAAETVAVATRHGLVNYRVLGHLMGMQARAALADFPAADAHADAVDELAERHERPLASVFTAWYRALRAAATGAGAAADAGYRRAASLLPDAGMPGLEQGLVALLGLTRSLAGRPGAAAEAAARLDPGADWGPYLPWAEPFLLLGADRRAQASAALRALPEPPADLLQEALTCLEAAAALELGDREARLRARDRLAPAAGELAGAGSGLLTLGPADLWLAALDDAGR